MNFKLIEGIWCDSKYIVPTFRLSVEIKPVTVSRLKTEDCDLIRRCHYVDRMDKPASEVESLAFYKR
jgi:hypothetical protein